MVENLRLRDGLVLLLKNGSTSELTNAFDLAAPYGRSAWNEFVCAVGYIQASAIGYARPYSEGWYLLTQKGQRRRDALDGADADQVGPPFCDGLKAPDIVQERHSAQTQRLLFRELDKSSDFVDQ